MGDRSHDQNNPADIAARSCAISDSPGPDSQNVDDFGLLNQSLETLLEFGDADFMFVSPTTGPDHKLFSSALWESIPAVQDGRYRIVLDDVWMAGIGYRAALTIMDEIAEELVS